MSKLNPARVFKKRLKRKNKVAGKRIFTRNLRQNLSNKVKKIRNGK